MFAHEGMEYCSKNFSGTLPMLKDYSQIVDIAHVQGNFYHGHPYKDIWLDLTKEGLTWIGGGSEHCYDTACTNSGYKWGDGTDLDTNYLMTVMKKIFLHRDVFGAYGIYKPNHNFLIQMEILHSHFQSGMDVHWLGELGDPLPISFLSLLLCG